MAQGSGVQPSPARGDQQGCGSSLEDVPGGHTCSPAEDGLGPGPPSSVSSRSWGPSRFLFLALTGHSAGLCAS